MKKSKKGMSLIVLVITIIVMITLAGVVVMGLSDNNPVSKANEAVIRSNLASFKQEFFLYIASNMSKNGITDELFIDAVDKDIKKYIPSITELYESKIAIKSGKLVFIGGKYNEKIIAYELGYLSEYADIVQDAYAQKIKILIKEFEEYIEKNNLESKRDKIQVGSNYLKNYMPSISNELKNNYEVIDGVLNYKGNDIVEQMALATSKHTMTAVTKGQLIIQGYAEPIKDTDEEFKNWEFEDGYVVGYKGVGGIVTIPDGYIKTLPNGTEDIVRITGIKGKNGKNIFTDSKGNLKTKDKEQITRVIVAKGIYKIENYALSNMGGSIPVNILNATKTIELGDGTGLEGSCGTYIYIVPKTGTYKFKLWGASGEGNERGKLFTKENIGPYQSAYGEKIGSEMGSQAGYGGYAEGNINLVKGTPVYVNIGGKGKSSISSVEDNGTGGYNGGGNGTIRDGRTASGGGGSTDIRIGRPLAISGDDSRVMVAGGGGGSDDFKYAASTLGNASNDGTGGFGGGANQQGGPGKAGFGNHRPGATLTTGYKLWQGEDALVGDDMGGGGGGYYGGFASTNSNAGASGGSGYALKTKVTEIIGVSGNSNLKTTYYGREKNYATYGNGAVEIIEIK